ncbi:MAG: nucleoside 2-deoxyribosyltransferase [Acetobacteraceae bacterium]|jgi:nucleoside 2-deoxyribosyltransferase
MDRPRVYLAGPMVFLPDPGSMFARMKAICDSHGLIGVSPLDNQTGLEGLPPGPDLMERIVRADIALMRSVDAGVFCLDGFRRGPEMDPGTAFEVGYMHALNKPLAGWTSDPRPYPRKVKDYFSEVFAAALTDARPGATGGTSGLTRDPDGMLVHSEGCVQNAMVHISIELAGGIVAADPDWEHAFATAVQRLAELIVLSAQPAYPSLPGMTR